MNNFQHFIKANINMFHLFVITMVDMNSDMLRLAGVAGAVVDTRVEGGGEPDHQATAVVVRVRLQHRTRPDGKFVTKGNRECFG